MRPRTIFLLKKATPAASLLTLLILSIWAFNTLADSKPQNHAWNGVFTWGLLGLFVASCAAVVYYGISVQDYDRAEREKAEGMIGVEGVGFGAEWEKPDGKKNFWDGNMDGEEVQMGKGNV